VDASDLAVRAAREIAAHPLGGAIRHDVLVAVPAFLSVVPDSGVAVALLTNGRQARELYRDLYAELLSTLCDLRMPPALEPPAEAPASASATSPAVMSA
jgi:hypothetical protein